MKATELRKKTKKELNEMVLSLLQEQFQLRMHKGMTEAPKHHLFKKVRKDVARIKTILKSL
ncbi:MAG: 50S ribosomal protein L29 [Gammaproteobacteria bacterium RIFCSPHIGHO2_12_FULL_40_19]|nr:MAG: 50S ribosomal protein L29 [Gammaproteobacteria bacterium RIFCSPHIGHO2_12_FULL_40_19]